MKWNSLSQPLSRLLLTAALAASSHAHAAGGYMAFLTNGPGGTSVTAGDAASYMRAGLDWDGATTSAGVATPTLLQPSIISSWRDATSLHLKLAIPDRTTTASGATLSCGDQLIVQVGPANTAATALQEGQEFRFEVVIQDNLISGGSVKKRLPNPPGHPLVGRWKAAAEASTTATASLTTGANKYTINLTIPLSEINSPASDFGLALAIVNDLGHSHGAAPAVNEAAGTAFPVAMGLTPESDPGLSCGAPASPSGETATGNWINPSTWGVGYFSVASVPVDVTLDQGPSFYLSQAIRIGRCSVVDFAAIPAVTVADWASIQKNVANNWYLYNPAGPCRMTIWIKASVSAPGIVKRRFLAVWGRPGISPQDWYFAGLTEPVAVTSPTTVTSFIWNDVPAVTFGSDHPCLRVYVLPEVLTAAQQAAVDALKVPATATGSNLSALESLFGVAPGSSKSAQMNFANIGTGKCTESSCGPVIGAVQSPEAQKVSQFSLIGTAYAQEASAAGRGNDKPRDDKPANLIRLVAQAFGVAVPQGNKNYVFVEPIGGLGWALPANLLAQGALALNLEVTNPKFTEKTFVNGNPVVIASPDRRILIAPVVSLLPGTQAPTLDLSALARFAETPVKPGETFKAQIFVKQGGLDLSGLLAKWWWLLLLLLIALALYLLRRRSVP